MKACLLVPVAATLASLSCSRPVRTGPPSIFPLGTVWKAELDAAIEPPLALDERRLYVSTRDGQLRALEREGGGEAWRVSAPGLVAAAPGTLIVRTPEGKVSSLQPRAGGGRWSTDSGVLGVLPAVIDRDLIYVAGQGVAALDLESGKVAWTVDEGAAVTALPVATATGVLVGEADGTLRLRARTTGASVWTFKTDRALLAPPFVDEKGDVYVGTADRRLLRLSGDKGQRRWRWKVGADVTSPAAVWTSLALFTSYDATLYAVKRGSGKLAFRVGLPSRPLSGALLAGTSAVVACHENELVGVSLQTGKAVGAMKLPAEIRTVPLLDKGRLFVGLRDRSVMALQLAGSGAREP